MTSKLTEGEYTVTVAQKDADALKGSVKVENEKVAKLEVLSDVAPFTSTDKKKATVGAKVSNQYGEDMTKLNYSDVTVTVAGAASKGVLNANGTLDLTLTDTAKEGDSVYITLVHAKTGVSTQATVKLSAASAVSDLTFGEVYNKDGKKLTQDTKVLTDKFYLPISAKDQYGKDVTTLKQLTDEVLITNTNPGVVTLSDVKTVSINDKDVFAIEVTGVNLAGTSNVIAVSKTTGASKTAAVNVAEGLKIASVSLNSPSELVTAKKDIMFPLTVIDTDGKELKTKKELDAIKDKLTTSAGSEIVEVKDKGLFVEVKGDTVSENQAVTVVVTTQTGKVATQTVVAKAEAKPTVITGLSDKKATALRAGETTKIANTDLIVEDQYGQVITDKKELAKIDFTIDQDPAEVFTITGAASAEKAITPLSEAAKSSKLTFKIYTGSTDADKKFADASAFTKTFTIVKSSEFTSYVVEDVDTIYAAKDTSDNPAKKGKYFVEAAYDQDLVVKGKTDAGETVTLKKGTDYLVTGKPAPTEEVEFAKDATTAKVSVTITINRTGEQLTKELTYSNVAPKVQDFIFTSAETVKADDAVAIDEPIIVSNAFSKANLDEVGGVVKIATTDQYGMNEFMNLDTLTIVPEKASEVTLTNNGTVSAKAVLAGETTSAKLVAKVKVGGVTKNINVVLKKAN